MKLCLETGPDAEWVLVSARFFGCKQQKRISHLKHQQGNLLEGFREAQRTARKSRDQAWRNHWPENEGSQPHLCPCPSDG